MTYCKTNKLKNAFYGIKQTKIEKKFNKLN